MTEHPWSNMRTARGLTQLEVAEVLNVTRQTIIRLEQGMFHNPSTAILVGLGELYCVPVGELINEYAGYVKEQRAVFESTHDNFDYLRSYQGSLHPLVHYRLVQNGYSRLGFCRAICLDYGPVADYETSKQRGLPDGLVQASLDLNWDLDPLNTAVANWRLKGHADK